MIQKIFIFIALCLIVVIAAIVWAVQSPWFWQQALMNALNHRWSDVVVKEIVIDHVTCHFPTDLTFANVTVKAKIKEMDVAGVIDAKVQFKGLSYQGISGTIRVPTIMIGSYLLTGINGQFTADGNTFNLGSFKGNFYGGLIEGNALVNYKPRVTYTVLLNLNGVDTRLLSDANPAVFEDLKGVVQGSIHAEGEGDRVTVLKALLNMPKAGEMKPELLQYLAQYIPQRQQIEDLIKNGQNVPLDNASAVITSITEEKFSSEIKMFASKLNLNINVTMDVNVDGGIKAVLEQINLIKAQ